MEKMKAWMQTVTQKKYLPLWIFAAVQLVYHILMREPEGSDAMWYFRNLLDKFTLKDYLTMRYETWSSRLLIEAVLVYLSRKMILWKVLDWIFWIFLAWALTLLFPEEKRDTACPMVVGILLIYPIWDLRTAGWIATSINYTWPLALGVFALHGITRVFYGKRTSAGLGILYVLATIYGANMEQMCAVLLAVNFFAVLYFIYEKRSVKTYWQVIGCGLAAAAEIVFIMTCPGNEARKNQEIINWMPNFGTLNLLEKICMGFVDTMHHLITSGNFLFLLFVILLAVFVFLKSDKIEYRCIAILPVFWNVWCVFFSSPLKNCYPTLSNLLKKNAYVDGSNYQLAANYIPMILYLLIVGCMLLSLVIICENWLELTAQTLLLALGLATRVIMGFTPTIYVSQERTFLYLYIILGVSAIWLVMQNIALLKAKDRFFRFLKTAGLCMVIFGVVLSIAEIGIVV